MAQNGPHTARRPRPRKPPATYISAPRTSTAEAPTGISAKFLRELQAYKSRIGPRAFALAVDDNGSWVSGSVSGVEAQAAANQEALSQCKGTREKAQIQAPCRLFAVEDKVVW